MLQIAIRHKMGITHDNNEKKRPPTLTIRFVLMTLIVLLSGYYLWVLYKAVTPNVSHAYQAYYIDHKTLFWQLNNPELSLTLPTKIDVSQRSAYLSREGWAKKPTVSSRSLNAEGGLYFTLSKPVLHPVRLTISTEPNDTRKIQLRLNQWQGDAVAIGVHHTFQITIPVSAWQDLTALQSLHLQPPAPISISQFDFALKE